MNTSADSSRPVTIKDLEEMAVLIINSVTEVLKGYATKEDLKQFATKEDLKKIVNKVDNLVNKVDNLSFDVIDIRRRVIGLETDRITKYEST